MLTCIVLFIVFREGFTGFNQPKIQPQPQPYVLPLVHLDHYLMMWNTPEGIRMSLNPRNSSASSLLWIDWYKLNRKEFVKEVNKTIELMKHEAILPDVFNLTELCLLPHYAKYCNPGAIAKRVPLMEESEMCSLPSDSLIYDEWCEPAFSITALYSRVDEETRWNTFPNVFTVAEWKKLISRETRDKLHLMFENIEEDELL
jgi:hypothetical protein